MSKLITAIPAEGERRWMVTLDGRQQSNVSLLTVEHPRFGLFAYGMTTFGYDGWLFHEAGGGGAVVLPHVTFEGELYVGLIRQNRPAQGGMAWNAPRGFLDPGEGHASAAVRELWEETGYRAGVQQVRLLPGEPCNPDSAFFDTSTPGEGIHFYAVAISADSVERTADGIAFRASVLTGDLTKQREEGIESARFFHWREAAGIADMFTVAAVGRLLADLR